MSIYCPECGEQILSRRVGFCPSCHHPLPESIRLSENAKEQIDKEYERARRAGKPGGISSEGGDYFPGDFSGGADTGGGGDCGGG